MTAAAAADDARTLDSDVLLAHQRRLAALGPTGHTGCAGTAADDRAVHAAGYVHSATGRRPFSPISVLLLECA